MAPKPSNQPFSQPEAVISSTFAASYATACKTCGGDIWTGDTVGYINRLLSCDRCVKEKK